MLGPRRRCGKGFPCVFRENGSRIAPGLVERTVSEPGGSNRCDASVGSDHKDGEAVLKRIKISHMREEPEVAASSAVRPAELVTIV